MKKKPLAAIAFLGFFYAGLLGGPLPVWAYDLTEYYPLSVGNRWLYAETMEDDATEYLLEKVLFTYPVNGLPTYLVGNIDVGCWTYDVESLTFDAQGLRIHGESDCDEGAVETQVFDPPIVQLPASMTLGETHRFSAGDLTASVTLAAEETVTVAAGTFQALRFELNLQEEEETEICSVWYARNLGLIKESCTFSDEADESCELIAAIIDGDLVGRPFLAQETESLRLASARMQACGLLVSDIFIQNQSSIERWWAFFRFDIDRLAWRLTEAGKGVFEGEMPQTPCALQGLSFTHAATKISTDNVSGRPELYVRVNYEGVAYAMGSLLNGDTRDWDFLFLQPIDSE